MRNLWVVLVVVCIFYSMRAEATVINYSGDESGFNTATAGLSKTLIDFEDLTLNDVIYDQYNPPVRFLTNEGEDIIASTGAWGTDALDEYPGGNPGGLCARLPYQTLEPPFVELQFSQPVWGVSLWFLDIHADSSGGIDVTLYNNVGVELESYWIAGSSDRYTHVAMLSDVQEIARIRVDTIYVNPEGIFDDGIGFDDITVVPEPATLLLLGLGGLALRRKHRAK